MRLGGQREMRERKVERALGEEESVGKLLNNDNNKKRRDKSFEAH